MSEYTGYNGNSLDFLKKNKILAMIKFTQDDQLCKRNSILAYFGEVKSSNCKKCSSDSCIN